MISQQSPAFIIGEIGSNHNLSERTGKKLIEAAAKAGVDAIKFQSLKFDQLYLPGKYSDSLSRLHQQIDISDDLLIKFVGYAKKRGLIALSAPTYLDSLKLLKKLNLAAYKIASPVTVGFSSLMTATAKIGKPLIVSTGYCTLGEIDRAVQTISASGNRQLVLMHCISSYPVKFQDVNLRFMNLLASRYKCLIGYSDHSLSVSLPAVAVALGARVIEKHFTLSRKAKGPDHFYALEPDELAEMVKNIRETEMALGSARQLLGVEKEMREKIMMKLVAAKDIPAGTILKREHLIFRRAPAGIEEFNLNKVLGRKVNRSVKKLAVFKWQNIKK